MKRWADPRVFLCIAIGWVALAGGAAAQDDLDGDVMFGVTRASYASERLVAAPYGPDVWAPVLSGSRVSPTLGVGVSVHLTSLLSLRGEALFIRKGLSSPSVVLDEIFVEFPLLAELEMVWREPVRFRVVAGLAPALEFRCRARRTPPLSNGSQDAELREADCEDFRSEPGDIGSVFGAGFGPVRVAGFALMPEIRLVLGGADLLSDRARERARHQTVSLLFAVSR